MPCQSHAASPINLVSSSKSKLAIRLTLAFLTDAPGSLPQAISNNWFRIVLSSTLSLTHGRCASAMPNHRNSLRKLHHIHEFIGFLVKRRFSDLRAGLVCQFSDGFQAKHDYNQKGQRFFSALSITLASKLRNLFSEYNRTNSAGQF